TGQLGSLNEWGVGRLVEPAAILAACENSLTKSNSHWLGTKVLVTAGGTREPIDNVRFIANNSSGKMGFALAESAMKRGANVTVIAANVVLPRSANIRYINVETAADLAKACAQEFTGCDLLLMAAAVSDFTPSDPISGKIDKKEQSHL